VVATEQKTTLELLDALVSALERRAPEDGGPNARRGGSERLRREMERIGLTAKEFSRLFGVPPGVVQNWTTDANAPPVWAEAAVSLLCQLTPRLRRRALQRPEPVTANGRREHPFSRIEEL